MKLRTFAFAMTLTAAVVRGAPFSAELATTRSGQTTTGAFHCQDQRYRFELVEDGHTLVVLADGQAGVTRLLSPAEKTYTEATAGEPMSLVANPFSTFAYLAKTKTVRAEGTETIAGVSCRKQVVLSGEQVWVIGWIAEGFDVPLKVEIPVYELAVELRNIKRGPQDRALFAVPADYKLRVAEIEPEPQPEWASQAAAAPVVTVPLEKTFADGEVVRVRTRAGHWISVEGTNLRKDEGSFTVLPFMGGKSLGSSEMATTSVDPGNSGAMSVGSQPKNADELAIRVGSGPMKLKIAYVSPPRGQPTDESAASGSAPAGSDVAPGAATPGSTGPAAELNGPTAVDIAARFEVAWKGPGANDDVITIARPDQPPRASVTRAAVREGNPVRLCAPSDPGEYELRYLQARTAKLLAKAPLTVNAVTATLDVPTAAAAASRIEVRWQGPAGDGDFISVALPKQPPPAAAARIAVRTGNPAKLWLPAEPGDYEVRYVLGRGTKLLGTAPLTVQAVTATLEVPGSAKPGAEIEVRWQGPGYPEDFVCIAQNSQKPNASLTAAKTKPGVPLKLRAPRQPGTYEVRYVLGRGPRLLATSPLVVEAE